MRLAALAAVALSVMVSGVALADSAASSSAESASAPSSSGQSPSASASEAESDSAAEVHTWDFPTLPSAKPRPEKPHVPNTTFWTCSIIDQPEGVGGPLAGVVVLLSLVRRRKRG